MDVVVIIVVAVLHTLLQRELTEDLLFDNVVYVEGRRIKLPNIVKNKNVSNVNLHLIILCLKHHVLATL